MYQSPSYPQQLVYSPYPIGYAQPVMQPVVQPVIQPVPVYQPCYQPAPVVVPRPVVVPPPIMFRPPRFGHRVHHRGECLIF